MDVVSNIVTSRWFLLTFPIIFLVLISFIINLFQIHRWRKIHLTTQWTALFFVAGVLYLVYELYELFILSYVLIVFILFLAIHLILQRRNSVEISLRKAFVLLLRTSFLIFLFAYIVFLCLYAIRFFA